MGGCFLLSYPVKVNVLHPLVRKKLYSPNAIAAYAAILGLPVGTFLYGLNVARRGNTVLGTTLCLVSGISYLFSRLVTALGFDATSLGGVFVFSALGLHQVESASFARAQSEGAQQANWWVPLLVVAAIGLSFEGLQLMVGM